MLLRVSLSLKMTHSTLKWLILIQLLLNEQALCRTPAPVTTRHGHPNTISQEDGGTKQSLLGSQPQLSSPHGKNGPSMPAMGVPKENKLQSSKHIISTLREKLKISLKDNSRGHHQIRGNISCGELLSATTLDNPSSTLFPQELLSLSMVAVLAVVGCQHEAETLVIRLFDLLGMADTEDLLMEVGNVIERRATHAPPPSLESPVDRTQEQSHLEAVMFNIRQLAMAGKAHMGKGELCEGWTRVNGTILLGKAMEGATGGLREAVRTCESLGSQCAGVTQGGLLEPGQYRAVLKKGSHIVPSESLEAECWIQQCNMEWDANSLPAAAGSRARRSPRKSCINKDEQQVYNVVEWIPGISTLYNMATAMYYASINCTETAKERAILSAVDLGTDALMAATGGSAGVAGYALGAGVKTGVKAGIKHLLTSMKEEDDLLVNQNLYSWEEGLITIN